LARTGLAAQGVVFLLIALLAVQVAVGGSHTHPDQSGALATIARQPFGAPLLFLLAAGFCGFALWQATEVIWGARSERDARKEALERAKAAAVALVYLGFGVTAVRIAVGSGSGATSSSTEKSQTATVLSWPGGRLLVGIAALVLIGVGVYSVVKGIRAGFEQRMALERLDPPVRNAVRWTGQAGYTAKGVVFGIVGALVMVAAVQYQPGKAGGLDVALKTLARQPYGSTVLSAIALGLACFGVFSLVDARFRKL
jgi:hypothetical protein